jgi:hypothetical protein
LDLFANIVPFNLLSEKHPYIRVPRLLHHDVAQHILIIEDLGSLSTVDKWLEGDTDLLESQTAVVGEHLGTFLADFHLSTTTQNREYLATQSKNDDIHNVIYAQVVQAVLDILNEYDIPNAKHTYEIIEREFRDVQQFPQKVLNLGDLWPGSILIGQISTTVGVIDWEFAGLSHPSQDIGQFGLSLHPIRLTLAAHLHYKILMEQDFSENYRNFSADLFTSYGTRLRERNAPWLSPDAIDGYIRSLWIIHGRELINSTTFSKSCPCQEPRCHHLQSAVQRGVKYILGAVASKLDYEKDDFLQPIYPFSDAPNTILI